MTHQQPNYPDEGSVRNAVAELENLPPLVFAGECRNLQARLAKCATGEAFLLQGILACFTSIYVSETLTKHSARS